MAKISWRGEEKRIRVRADSSEEAVDAVASVLENSTVLDDYGITIEEA